MNKRRWQNRVLDRITAAALMNANLVPIIQIMELCPSDVRKLTRLIDSTVKKLNERSGLPERVADWRMLISGREDEK